MLPAGWLEWSLWASSSDRYDLKLTVTDLQRSQRAASTRWPPESATKNEQYDFYRETLQFSVIAPGVIDEAVELQTLNPTAFVFG
jgi:hypothetical protein